MNLISWKAIQDGRLPRLPFPAGQNLHYRLVKGGRGDRRERERERKREEEGERHTEIESKGERKRPCEEEEETK